MFTRIRVVTSLLVVLVLFAALQLTSGSLFIRALYHDKTSFSASQLSAQNLAAITDAYMSLNQSRVVLTRMLLRITTAKLEGNEADVSEVYLQQVFT